MIQRKPESATSMGKTWRWIVSVILALAGFAAGMYLVGPGSPQSALPSRPDAPETTRSAELASQDPWAAGPSAAGDSRPPPPGVPPRLVDVTKQARVDFRHENGHTGQYNYLEIMGAGVGVFDFDGDGLLDLYFVNGNHIGPRASPDITNRLYRNNGDWTFTDVTEQAGVGHCGYGQGCCVGDYDNDGDLDLFVSNFGTNVLYRNNGDGTLVDVTAQAGLRGPAGDKAARFSTTTGTDGLTCTSRTTCSSTRRRWSGRTSTRARTSCLTIRPPRDSRGPPTICIEIAATGRFRM